MKKNFPIIILALLLVIITATCKKDIPVFDVNLDKNKLLLEVGQTETLIATVNPPGATNKSVIWSCSDNNVVTIDKGNITAVAVGNATITVTTKDANRTTTCAVKVYKPYLDEPEMVFVEGGTFTMGCTEESEGDCWSDELPLHEVTLNSFYIAKYELTQNQWEALMGENPSYIPKDNCPVENVSWDDVHDYINKLNAATGKKYRLPTEAEWEFAARGGNKSEGYKYSGSNDHSRVVQQGYGPFQVGKKFPNELGIYDMSGNVWEWCSDWYGAYSKEPQINPQGPNSGEFRILRGGGWNSTPQPKIYRVSVRSHMSDRHPGSAVIGFRLVLDKE